MTSTTTSHPTLNVGNAVALATVICFAQRGARVRFLSGSTVTDGEITDMGDLLVEGTARHICDERGGFAGPDDDVRDLFLRITTTSGMERFMPVDEAVVLVRNGAMAED